MTGQLILFPVRLYVRGAKLLLHTAEDLTERAVMTTLRVAGTLGNLRPGSEEPESAAPPWPADIDQRASREPEQHTANGDEQRSADGRERDDQSAAPERPSSAGTSRPSPTAAPERDPRIESAPDPASAPAPPSNGASAELASERLEREGAAAPVDLEADEREPEHVSEEPTLVQESADPGAEEGVGAAITVREPWEGYDAMKARQVVARLSGASGAELAAVQLYESTHRNRQTVVQAVERELKAPRRT